VLRKTRVTGHQRWGEKIPVVATKRRKDEDRGMFFAGIETAKHRLPNSVRYVPTPSEKDVMNARNFEKSIDIIGKRGGTRQWREKFECLL